MTILDFHRTRDRLVAGALAVLLFLAGGAAAWLYARREPPAAAATEPRMTPMPPAPSGSTAAAPDTGEIAVTLDAQTLQRVRLEYATVVMRPAGSVLRVPGVVEPHAYKEVLVTPLVSGRVQQVQVELGDRVRTGQTMATIFSPDLADAQTRFLSMRAALEAERARLSRTERLVEIGAASRQELEEVRARHTELATEVEGARSRLVLLGLSTARIDALRRADQISAVVAVPAPSAGEVIERTANPGLVVDPSMMLFKVADLSRVWVIANLYERNVAQIAVGDRAVITSPAFPDLTVSGRVSYLDPGVDPATRTSKVRIEVDNPAGRLRLQMYVDVTFQTERAAQLPMVPAAAVQQIGDRSVVYVKDRNRDGTFLERRVELGERDGDHVHVRSGLSAGETVVTAGSFHLRAERERTAPLAAAPSVATPSPAAGNESLFAHYEAIRAALAADRLEGIASPAEALASSLSAAGDREAAGAAQALRSAKDLKGAREQFGVLSERLVPQLMAAKIPDMYGFFCPMTKRPWAQRGEKKANPYFGAAMIDCGTPLETGSPK